MGTWAIAAVGLWAAGTGALAQAAKVYPTRAFFETTRYSLPPQDGHAFSSDGKKLLISSDKTGVVNVYVLPVAGGVPEALTTSTGSATFATSWFPKDDRILFTADQGGNELNHLFVRGLDGKVTDLTPGEKLKAEFAGWSTAGTTFYVATNERDPKAFDLYAYDAKTYVRKLVFTNAGGLSLSDLSGDGRWLVLQKLHSSANTDLFLADLSQPAAAPKLITAHQGAVAFGAFEFTPDDKALIYSTDEPGEFTQAWRYDLGSGAKSPVVAEKWDVANLKFSPTGRYRADYINADASTVLKVHDLKSGKMLQLSGLPAGDLTGVRFSDDEKTLAITVASDTSPSDIFVADVATGQARRLTKALNPQVDEKELVEASVARFKSYDGLEVPGILYRPKGATATNPAHAIVWVHGGPGGQSRRGYSSDIQNLVNKGYAVYAINNRGSSGYGKTFFHLDDKRHGDADLKDVTAAARWLKSLDWVADDGVAIMGGSYGGYMVAAALAFEPEAFDAGIDIFGVTNWVRTLEQIPAWWGSERDSLYDELGDPKTDGERLRKISPLFHATNIKRPLLVVQGKNDPRVLQVESDELVAAVKANGVPVEYIVFPDEGHGFQRRENRVTASEAYVKFLDAHLRK
ncbi:MAG: S9 family peptidase [Alphaproteobacteria bacterium]|nr:S9 family peptidase [Alphaproteobacteria bacterium]MBU1515614.1 S9 family peptidase [Alphaproteobacteria bacterium]MBU2096949.1 S9 family peptidase [Alphaproteobacteria bacterium]MBU2149604.1 S9 family peptidase [Alphaproteobacteria bacterium]MBU2305660.1 S9 family peptidase [Alphaproteobacteria bacterium]